jgi:flagellar motor switch protein FliM
MRLDEISEEDLPSGESLAEDFERFLRDQLGEDG